jgi:dihydrodipicolinate reductase
MKKIVAVLLAFAGFIFSASAQETPETKGFHHQHKHGMMTATAQSQSRQLSKAMDGFKQKREYYRKGIQGQKSGVAQTAERKDDDDSNP